MAGVKEDAERRMLDEIFDYFLHRDERRAVKKSGKIRFWPEGMLEQLREISDGKATAKTYKELEKKLRQSERPVREAIMAMRDARNKLAGSRVSIVIDNILHHEDWGKSGIRWDIGGLLDRGRRDKEKARLEAIEICKRIEVLNFELDRLYRLVYG